MPPSASRRASVLACDSRSRRVGGASGAGEGAPSGAGAAPSPGVHPGHSHSEPSGGRDIKPTHSRWYPRGHVGRSHSRRSRWSGSASESSSSTPHTKQVESWLPEEARERGGEREEEEAEEADPPEVEGERPRFPFGPGRAAAALGILFSGPRAERVAPAE